jgi:hypothetical protein
MRPWSAINRAQASTVPGTVTACGDCRSIAVTPARRSASRAIAAGVPIRPIVGDEPVATFGRQHREAVAPDAGRAGLHHALDCASRDGRVDRASAGLEDLDRGQRRGRMRGRGHSVASHRQRTTGMFEIAHEVRLPNYRLGGYEIRGF